MLQLKSVTKLHVRFVMNVATNKQTASVAQVKGRSSCTFPLWLPIAAPSILGLSLYLLVVVFNFKKRGNYLLLHSTEDMVRIRGTHRKIPVQIRIIMILHKVPSIMLS